ncbi:MAG: hypothetical protein J7642_21305 [Cyanobacteria bacterium SBC]|nr:hypothetical protein [Cyanobacteria bacterium SBC]
MSDVTLIYRPEKEVPPGRTRARSFDGLRLQPGTNKVSIEAFSRLESHSGFKRCQTWGAVTVLRAAEKSGGVDSTETSDLDGYNTDETAQIVAATDNLKLLEQWRESETRKTVKNQISRRIAEIEKGEA